MAPRKFWYIGQRVTAQEMRSGDDGLEQGTYDLAVDMGFVGVVSGGSVVEHAGTPNLTVDVSALLARTPVGERVRSAALSIVDCAFDYLGQPTAVTTPGFSRIVDVYAVFDRILSDPRIDATNATVYFVQDESFGFDVVQGAEAASPAAPAALADGVLLARITLTFGQTQIVNANINTGARQSTVKIPGTPFTIDAGTFEEALTQMLERYNDHVTGADDQHDASTLMYAGSGPFANGAFLAAGSIETSIDNFVSYVSGTGIGTSGARYTGCEQLTAASGGVNIPAGTTYSVLASLKNAVSMDVAARGNWAGGTTNPATDGQSAFAKIISDLASTASALTQGANHVGLRGTSYGLAAWQDLGAASTLYAAFLGMNRTTGTYDGASFIGAKAVVGVPNSLTVGTARSQTDELLGFVNSNSSAIATLQTDVGDMLYRHPSPATSTTPSYSNSTTSFTQIDGVAFVSPGTEQVVIGDIVDISFTCTSASTTQDGVIALFIQHEGDPSPTEIPGSRVRVTAGTTVPVCIVASHVVTSTGYIIITAQAAKKALGGTITVVEAYRLEAKRRREP